MYFLVTNDVEEHSIALNRLDDETAGRVSREGVPKLLDLYAKYDVEATFYYTGTFAERFPESMEMVKEQGHELGCHGYLHEVDRAFDVLSYDEQVADLMKAKQAIEAVAGNIVSFRAPAVRINNQTVKALETTGFLTDSSVSSQRFDGLLSFGAREKLKWLFSPRLPYYLHHDSPFQRGDSSILEVPISAYILAYIGTTMRVSPAFFNYLEKFIFRESMKRGKPIVFLFHPVEVLGVGERIETTRRSDSFLGYLFGDLIRQQLKLRNLGDAALELMDGVLKRAKKAGFEFISVKEYHQRFREERT